MFEKIIIRVAKALKKHKIPYMIIGGQAVLLYGTPRLTRDIDITVGVSIDKLDSIIDVTRSARLKIIPDNPEDFTRKTFVLPANDAKTGIRVDLIFSFTPYERQAIERAKTVVMAGGEVKFATIEDIIIHKIFSGRARDLEDVRAMLVKNPNYNMVYIKKWLSEFDKTLQDKKFSNTFKDIVKGLK